MELTNSDRKKRRNPEIDISSLVYGKVPPQAKDLEEAVLGAIMLNVNAFSAVSEIIQAESFYVDAHQRVFRACQKISDRYINCELLSVVEELRKSEELDLVGGPYAITKMTNAVVSTANLEYHCRIIQEKYIQRELIKMCGETISIAYEDKADAFNVLDEHETKLISLTNGFIKADFQTSQTLADKAIKRVEFLLNNKEQLSGVPTGFKPLDRLTNGWQPTDLIILAARPSVGKTSFALNIAKNAATDKIKPTTVGFFSLEMSAEQLVQRILSSESMVHLEKIKRGRIYDNDYLEFTKASMRFSSMPIFIDDTASLNIFEFRAKARRLVNKHKAGLIIIDYLQLMSGTGERHSNREQEIAKISREIKGLAKQLHIPIIALSQMSRAIETRKEKPEPMLSDLRESGAIEQDTDMVMFLYRPDYQMQDDEIDPSIKGEAICKVAKHRNGCLEKIPFKTDLSIQTWYDPIPVSSQFPITGNFKPISLQKHKEEFDEGFGEPSPF